MSLESQTVAADEASLIRPVPLNDLFAAYRKWDEQDDAILAEFRAVDDAVAALEKDLGLAGVGRGAETGGSQLDSADEAIGALGGLRTELAQAQDAINQAQQALADARKDAEASLASLAELKFARIVMTVLAVLLAYLAAKLVFGL